MLITLVISEKREANVANTDYRMKKLRGHWEGVGNITSLHVALIASPTLRRPLGPASTQTALLAFYAFSMFGKSG